MALLAPPAQRHRKSKSTQKQGVWAQQNSEMDAFRFINSYEKLTGRAR
jgi:hypothetical protein